ncbi:hypothetical protein [Nonomuraea sediminis]|uniref:hypothetical protein n=1 Tax=Nonomuraea sediminis TaxID=2835864 RepID=UPI001BDD8645|nr:hypothetical protein [Nonomuraea sediminis]
MPNPTDSALVKRDWILIVTVLAVATSTVIASFTAQSGLGELAGWRAFVTVFDTADLHLSWLLPLTVDAYGVGATRIATNKARYSAEVRKQAFGHALAAVAVSVLANAVYHLIEAHVIVLGSSAWVLVVAVSIVPPVALGGLAHLLSVAARDEIEPVAVVVPAVPEPVVAPVAVEAERVAETPLPTVAEPVTVAAAAEIPPAVPDPIHDVPPQVNGHDLTGESGPTLAPVEPVFSHQEQPGTESEQDDPLGPVALSRYLPDLVGGELPTVRTIKDEMSVGTDRARRLQTYLGQLVQVSR